MLINKTSLRVIYRDTDQMGRVYYANYLAWFEAGRNEFFREAGMEYRELEKKDLYLPVAEAYCRYKKPAFYDDLIVVETSVKELRSSMIEFSYRILRDDTLLARGTTKHMFINKQGNAQSVPEEIYDEICKAINWKMEGKSKS